MHWDYFVQQFICFSCYRDGKSRFFYFVLTGLESYAHNFIVWLICSLLLFRTLKQTMDSKQFFFFFFCFFFCRPFLYRCDFLFVFSLVCFCFCRGNTARNLSMGWGLMSQGKVVVTGTPETRI